MHNLKYHNEYQFLNDFSQELRNSLTEYIIESNKHIGFKEFDLFLKNSITGSTYAIEVKGNPKDNSLPPEIIPWLKNTKTTLDLDKANLNSSHFIVLSLSNVNDQVKKLFESNGLEIFEYQKHKANLTGDFITFLSKLEEKETK